MSKRQSMSPQTVLLRTTPTRTITILIPNYNNEDVGGSGNENDNRDDHEDDNDDDCNVW